MLKKNNIKKVKVTTWIFTPGIPNVNLAKLHIALYLSNPSFYFSAIVKKDGEKFSLHTLLQNISYKREIEMPHWDTHLGKDT